MLSPSPPTPDGGAPGAWQREAGDGPWKGGGNRGRAGTVEEHVKVLAMALLVVITGCSGRSAGGAMGPSEGSASACQLAKTFAGDGLTFHFPRCWRSASYAETSSFSSSVVDLSDQAMHEPCRRLLPSETVCGWPVNRLGPGHVLVRWSLGGSPGWTLSSAPGQQRTVGGRPARSAVSRQGPCRAISGDETFTVTIARPSAPDNWLGMTACLRSPHMSTQLREVRQMIASVTFSGP